MAAAALAVESVGVQVVSGALSPLLGRAIPVVLSWRRSLLSSHVYSIVGTGLVAVMVLGGCNSANLIDGLMVCSGVTGIALIGLTPIGMMRFLKLVVTLLKPQSLAVARMCWWWLAWGPSLASCLTISIPPISSWEMLGV